MGYMRHHAIIVTSFDEKRLKRAHRKLKAIIKSHNDDSALQVSMAVTPISKGTVNGYASFMLAPDGSKEGWPQSDRGNVVRNEFVTWLNEQAFDDGSNCLTYVEVQFGDDDGRNKVLRSDRDTYDEYIAKCAEERK